MSASLHSVPMKPGASDERPWMEQARAVVAGWPPLTDADSRALSKVALTVTRRRALEEQAAA